MLKKMYGKFMYGVREVWDLLIYICKRLKGKIFPKSLLARFILIILLPLIVLQIFASTVFFEKHWSSISRRLAQDIVGEIKTLTYVMEEYPDTVQTLDLEQQLEKNLNIESLWINLIT